MVAKDILLAMKARCFPQQLSFIKDKSKRKLLFVGRRAGKSTAEGIYLTLAGLSTPGISLTYFGLTSGSAEDTMYPILLGQENGILPEFLKQYEYKYNNVEKLIEFNNGSTIKFTGLDVSYKEVDKVLGSKKFMIIIDECQNQNQDLEKVITIKAGPCVSDYLNKGGGQIVLSGTAGDFMGKHYWYQAVTNPKLGWSIHHWEHDDNPHMKEQKRLEQEQFLKQYGPAYVDTKWWKQQYLCQWVKENDARVYNYRSHCALTDQVQIAKLNQNLFKPPCTYILATDLGHNDDCAFALMGYHKFDPKLYIIESQKHKALNLDNLADILKSYKKRFPITYWPIDMSGSGKLIIEDFRKRYGIPFVSPKSKVDKLDYINQLNSDFICNKIGVIEGQNTALLDEWQELLWDKKALDQGYRKEAEKYANHLSDAVLYGFSQAKHYWNKEEPKPIDLNTYAINAATQLAKNADKKNRLKSVDPNPFNW